MIKIALTGHRPDKLWGYDYQVPQYQKLKETLMGIILAELNLQEDKTVEIITGMAQGADTVFAAAGIELKRQGYNVKLHAAIPFEGQDGNWPQQARQTYANILTWCDIIQHVCNPGYEIWKMQVRNEYMVDKCDKLIAVWDGSKGGTGNCVKYATKVNREIIYLTPASIAN